jgi:hypothetical protein
MRIQQFTNTTNIKTSLIIAAGTLAIGSLSVIPAAPAGAVAITNGQLNFSDGTLDFFNATPGANIVVNFNPGNVAFLNGANGSGSTGFNAFFTGAPFSLLPVTASTGNFSFVSGNTYRLTNDLNFVFNNGVTATIGANSTFTNTITTGIPSNSQFSIATAVGALVKTGPAASDSTPLQISTFQFSDAAGVGGGNYSFIATASPVPEPFTIIGSIVGGAAALRMRKKMSKSVED